MKQHSSVLIFLLTAALLSAADAPDFQQKLDAVRKQTRAGQYAEAGKAAATLEKEELSPAQQLRLLGARIELQQARGECEALPELYRRQLAFDILKGQDRRIAEGRLINSYVALGQYGKASDCAESFIADTTRSDKDRLNLRRTVLWIWLHKAQNTDKGVEAWNRLVDDPALTPDERAKELLGMASLLFERGRKADAERAEQRIEADAAISNRFRLAVLRNSAARLMKSPKTTYEQIEKQCAGFLARPALTPDERAGARLVLMEAVKQKKQDHPARIAMAKKLLAESGLSAAVRLDAIRQLCDSLILAGRTEEALAFARQPLSWQEQLSPDEQFDALRHYGGLVALTGDCDGAVEIYRKIQIPETGRVTRLIAEEYLAFYRYDDAVKTWLDGGNPGAALTALRLAHQKQKAHDLAVKLLNDESQTEQVRRQAYEALLDARPDSAALRRKYRDFYRQAPTFGQFQKAVFDAMYYGNYALTAELMDMVHASDSKLKNNAVLNEFYVRALGALKRLPDAERLCGELARHPGYTPLQKYRFALLRALYAKGEASETELRQAFDAVHAAYAMIDRDARAEEITHAGRAALIARMTSAAQTLEKIYDEQFVSLKKRSFTVPFFDTPVTGISGLPTGKDLPPAQFLDRRYGGKLDFFVTDVSTGNRGTAVGTEKAGSDMKYTAMYIFADENGLHVLYRNHDSKVREVKAGLTSAGVYEMYLAPGPDQPYTCVLPDMDRETVDLWHTMYPNPHHRRIPAGPPLGLTLEQTSIKDGFLTHMFLSWDSFYDKLPDGKTPWEFETIHWGRTGGLSWGGSRCVHGRSNWGQLQFSFTDAQRNQIRRKILYRAAGLWKKEKKTNREGHGVIDFWKDPVLGDAVFYEKHIRPWEEKMDSFLPLVTADMSDADVEKVYREAVPGWREAKYVISEMRRKYLEEIMSEE